MTWSDLMGVVLVLVAIAATRAALKGLRYLPIQADERFEAVKVFAGDERYRLDGKTALVVHDVEKWFDEDYGGLHLIRICRNPAGEYFYVIIDGENDVVKHLSVDRARLVLRQFPQAYRREFGEDSFVT